MEIKHHKLPCAKHGCDHFPCPYCEVDELKDLIRFLAETWDMIDRFVYDSCDGDSLMKYPVVQGTRNQINLRNIGRQDYNKENVAKAVKRMLND